MTHIYRWYRSINRSFRFQLISKSDSGSDNRYDSKSEYRNLHKTRKTAIISQLLIIVIMLTIYYYIQSI